MRYLLALCAAIAVLLVSVVALAEVPTLINYQGILTDAGGSPITTPVNVTFSIFQDPAGGTAGWMETQAVSPDADGRFTALLGSVAVIPITMFDWHERYLEVQVAGDAPFPRVRFVSAAYAFHAKRADSASLSFSAAPGSVNSAAIVDGEILFSDVSDNGAANGQVMKWNGTAWVAAPDDVGSGGGWVDDGAVVRLANGMDKVGIGTVTPNEQLEITGNLRLPLSTTSTGVIESGDTRFIHNFGTENTFIGWNAGNLTMFGTGRNTAIGHRALENNTRGWENTAIGDQALTNNNEGFSNTACGNSALHDNTTGVDNTANGNHALASNTTGTENTANGNGALIQNTTGRFNTASGCVALPFSSNGQYNTACGGKSLYNTTTGSYNTVSGFEALSNNTTGNYNTAIGYQANVSAGDLTNASAIGAKAVVSASNCMVLGGTGTNAVKVGIGTTTPAGALDVVSTTGAFIVPRMTTVQRDALAAVNGMIVYNTTTDQFNFREAGIWVTK